MERYILTIDQLEELYSIIKDEYKLISPTLKDGVIQYSQNIDFKDLPFGYTQMESAGFYTVKTTDDCYFSYIRPYNSLKQFLRPPKVNFMTVRRIDNNLTFEYHLKYEKYAFFDVRRCDLKALYILDKVFIENKYPDIQYKTVRENMFIVGVNCLKASDVCFCESMDINFEEGYGADIFITEIDKNFLVEVLTEKGKNFLNKINVKKATEYDLNKKEEVIEKFKTTIKKKLNTENLKDILYSKIDSPYWEELGKRCLSCTSCTQVCPTCFCFDIREENSLDMKVSERYFVWDSCFNQTFATVHKFNLREKISHRYRQWLMHKMAYWQDQFGTFGCIGCGRCITWCPVKIDIQIETQKLRDL
ncbi:MAG: 4Fe-4S dicluster domain-containing protein [Hydrogenothermaceae bacterium]